jgi:MFS superfamily sulfate permease-like transporter
VFLVALPLCLGIAHASGAPLLSGLVAGVVGGVLVGWLSGSSVSVSGPAAGLVVIVVNAIGELGGYGPFAAALLIAGILQIGMAAMRLGTLGHYFPTSVIRGMLAAIGAILVLKQIPHAFGWDSDPEGEMAFEQPDGETTFSELVALRRHASPSALVICLISFAILWVTSTKLWKKLPLSTFVPGALIVVVCGAALNALFATFWPTGFLGPEHRVGLPPGGDLSQLWAQLSTPDWSALLDSTTWSVAITLAVVASLESLLSVEATDKLDPRGGITPTNRELFAQGVGNSVSALLGGLPVTAVIVRSTANITAGARTKLSAIAHGVWLLVAVAFLSDALSLIPLSSLAAILIAIGLKLSPVSLWKAQWQQGHGQFVPFIATFLAILFTDLLFGIIVGTAVGAGFALRAANKRVIWFTRDGDHVMVRFRKDLSFFNKAALREALGMVREGDTVIVDGTPAHYVDHDIIETLEEFGKTAQARNINVLIKRTPSSANEYFRSESQPYTQSGMVENENVPKAAA